jgi:hypothetical protein
MYNYTYLKSSDVAISTHRSYGLIHGNYIIDDIKLKEIIENHNNFKSFALVEKKTDYYKLMFDFDYKDKNNGYNTYKNQTYEITDYIIILINKTLKKIFKSPDLRIIYCDKNIGKGIHIYYPNIIVNLSVHTYVYRSVYDIIIQNKKFKLTLEQWDDIFDDCVFKDVSLRLPYFYINSAYYKPNIDLSTYPIPDNKYDIVKLCSIRTSLNNVVPELLIEIKADEKIIKKTKQLTNKIKILNKPIEFRLIEKIPIYELEHILDCYPENYFTNYNTWFMIGSLLYNCNNTEEACKLFYKKSKIGKYKDVSYEHIKEHFYNFKIMYYYDPNILRYQARKLNYKLFDTIKLNIPYDKQYYETIKFSSPKIINLINSSENTFIENELDKYFNDNKFKFFILKSPYGTGKSTMIKLICDGIRYDRILFITHRQSLALDFMKDFQELGFYNYLNKANFNTNNNRLIVNIDSLHLLKSTYNFLIKDTQIKEFDLIILDEICSLLKHFESNLMEKKEGIYNIFHHLLTFTPKIICCDGDISNRECEYLKRFDENINIYENIYIPRQYNYIFHYDENNFIKLIEEDLKNKLNIVISSMSSSFCQKIEKLFYDKYNVLCITAKSDDDIKRKLADIVNQITTNNIQLFVYSPCITVGVNISINNYFNKIYGFMCSNSISARDFNQMLARIRNPINNNIRILLDTSISRSQIANYYDFDEVKELYCSENSLNINDLTTYELLRLWNAFEDINNLHYILPIFIDLITKKGHSYELLDECKKSIHNKYLIEEIILAENIDYDTYKCLLEKQKENDLTKSYKLSIEKFLYSYTFNYPIENIDNKFMKAHYGKRHIVHNNNLFITLLNDYQLNNNNVYNKFDTDNKLHKMNYLKKLLNHFGFMKIDDKINKMDFENKISTLNDIIDDKFRLLFELKKEEVFNLSKIFKTNKKILGFINSLVNEYGVEITAIRKKKYCKETKKVVSSIDTYVLNISDIIKDIPKRIIDYNIIE